MDELKQILQRVRMALGEEDYTVMNAVVETLSYLTHLAKDKQAAEIYRILGSSKSEKTRKVLRVLQIESATDSEPADDPTESEKPAETPPESAARDGEGRPAGGKKKTKGHGPQWRRRLQRGSSNPGFAGVDETRRPLPVRQGKPV